MFGELFELCVLVLSISEMGSGDIAVQMLIWDVVMAIVTCRVSALIDDVLLHCGTFAVVIMACCE